MLSIQTYVYDVEDIYALPDGQRADYMDAHAGQCEVFPAPFAVFLNADDRNYVEPDISVICDKNRIDDRGCNGAPNWVIEITSPSNSQMDYGIKLFKYCMVGVREYWIVNPQKKTVLVFDFEKGKKTQEYSFEEDVPACIYEGFTLNIEKMLEEMSQ